MISIKDGQLHTDLYSKPTDAQQFLHWTFCHPKHTRTSLPYGLAFRLNRICSSQESLQKRITELEGFPKARGYPNPIIKRQISKALEIPRSHALEPRATRCNNTDRILLVITYHPSLPKLSQILNKHLASVFFIFLTNVRRQFPTSTWLRIAEVPMSKTWLWGILILRNNANLC